MTNRIARGLAEAIIVLSVVITYFAYVFRLSSDTPLTWGMGDWVDPYFINYLLEHWDYSLRHLTDPFSPLMFFPARKTLGYSHGLILYVPFYSLARVFLDPLRAYNVALFLVFISGSVCLYLIFRKGLRIGFIESLVLTLFFCSSRNVTNEATSVWSQRASVFLIPPILLMAIGVTRVRAGRLQLALGFLWGLLAFLLFTQDFYTAQLALLMAALLAGGLVFVTKPVEYVEHATRIWNAHRSYVFAVSAGAALGVIVFAWIYLGVFLDHLAFPDDELRNQLILARVDRFKVDWSAFERGYLSLRPFIFALLLGAAAVLPMSRTSRNIRVYAVWVMLISAVVLLIPIRFNEVSIWKMLFAPVPGLSAIRDPKRIIPLYELAVVLLTGYAMTRVPARSFFRVTGVLVAVALLVTGWNPERFMFRRDVNLFDKWIRTPIAIEPSCRSFFIRKASDAYSSRSFHMWALYGGDAMFIALTRSIPTLNGYSAWKPNGWRLVNPHDPDYSQAVAEWISMNNLHDVCELDIEKRKMSVWPQKPDFSGEWTLNRDASMLSPVVAPAVQSGALRIEHREPSVTLHLTILLDGKPFESKFEMMSDGREVVATYRERRTVSTLRWDGDALVATWRVQGTNGEVTISFRYQLQDGGRRVRAAEQIRGGGRDQDNVWVFERP